MFFCVIHFLFSTKIQVPQKLNGMGQVIYDIKVLSVETRTTLTKIQKAVPVLTNTGFKSLFVFFVKFLLRKASQKANFVFHSR